MTERDFEAEALCDPGDWSDFFEYAMRIHKKLEAATKPAGIIYGGDDTSLLRSVHSIAPAGVQAAPGVGA